MQFLISLLDHPILLVILLMCFLGFIGMTYDFVLRLYGKKPFLVRPGNDDDEDSTEPPEPANVPKPPTDPNDTLKGEAEIEGAEEVEDEDGNKTVEYIFKAEDNPYDNWPEPWAR